MINKIFLGSDHAGLPLKEHILNYLFDRYTLADFGTFTDMSCDYPDYAHKVARSVNNNPDIYRGILVCGTGAGMSMVANRYINVRAILCTNIHLAEQSRRHGDANIICLGARILDKNEAFDFIECFLTTPFDGGRHEQRLKKFRP